MKIHNTKLYNTLFKHQKDTIEWAMNHNENKLMFHLDMGLGKTRVSLAYGEQLLLNKTINTFLIICQGTKMLDWKEEVEELLPNIPVFIIDKGKSFYTNKKNRFEEMKAIKSKVIIISYDKLWRWEEDITKLLSSHSKRENDCGKLVWNIENVVVLADESQKMKSRKSKVGKFGVKLADKVEHFILLTGDAISNGLVDLYNQMKIMGLDLGYTYFEKNFLITKKLFGTNIPIIVGYKNKEILMDVLKAQALFIKTEEVMDLPKQNFIPIHLEMKDNTYDRVKKTSVYNDDITFENAAILFGGLRQLASGFIRDVKGISNHKTKALQDLLESSKDDFVIFYNFVEEKNDIINVLNDMKIKYYEMNGQTKNTLERNNYDGRKVIVSQFQSGAVGQNWQDFNHTLYYSPPVSGELYKQSLKRTHRVGQEKPVFYYFFKTKNTLEDKIYETLAQAEDYTYRMYFGEDK